MTKIRAFINIFNDFTGVTARRNSILSDVRDWVGTVNQFISTYGLDKNNEIEKLLEDSGNAKFDLTVIITRAHHLIAKAGNLKNKQAASQIVKVVDEVESLKRYMLTPTKQKERLSLGVKNLRSSLELLENMLGKIDQ